MATTHPEHVETPERATTAPAEPAPAASPLDRHEAPVTTETTRKNGKATTSMVLGIVGVVAAIIPLLAWVLGGIALGLGISANNDARRLGGAGSGKAMAGIVLGAIAIAAGILIFIANVSMMSN